MNNTPYANNRNRTSSRAAYNNMNRRPADAGKNINNRNNINNVRANVRTRPSDMNRPTSRPVSKNAPRTRAGAGSGHERSEKKQVFAYRTKQIISTGIKPMIMISRNEGKIKTVKAKKKAPVPVSVFVLALICTIVFMFMIVSYVQINEYTLEVSQLRSELAELSEEEKQLNLELDRKNDLRSIEEYVSQNLGMVKSDQIVKKHVSVSSEDKIEVVSSEPIPEESMVTTMMSSVLNSFRGFWEYIG